MNDNGIACTLNGHEGRIKNLRYDSKNDTVVGDFYYHGSKDPTYTDALKVQGIHKKAKKALEEAISAIIDGQKKKKLKKEPVLG